jgi:hypothetical protein
MKDFRAVSIISQKPLCEAARAPSGQRKLMAEGTCLPLKDCTMPELCKCRYQKHADRRTDEDRRMLGSTLRGSLYAISERRCSGARARRLGDIPA